VRGIDNGRTLALKHDRGGSTGEMVSVVSVSVVSVVSVLGPELG
jgi:hypothetical protein